jgi:hypothetical protein
MKNLFIFSVFAVLICTGRPSYAQDTSTPDVESNPFFQCEKTDPENETNDILYKGCFTPPSDQFYGRALMDFSVQNTDLNALLQTADKSTRRRILDALKSLFIENTDTARFILSAKATDGNGSLISLGHANLFSIKKVGNKNYALSAERRYAPLPVRFLALPGSQVEFTLSVFAERQANSKIAQLLGKVAKFAGVSIPTIVGTNLTSVQKDFIALDEEISSLLSSQQIISNFVPLSFDPSFAQSYESKFALERFLPEGAQLQLRIATNVENSIFPQVSQESNGGAAAGNTLVANPGGLRADQFKNTPFLGQQLTNHILNNLGLEDYVALRQAINEKDFHESCWKLDTYLQTGPLALTSSDKLRVSWAHISGNPLLKKKSVREAYCMATKEDNLRSLGLGLPELEGIPLPDAYFVILDKAQSEAEAARIVVSDAISKHNTAKSAAESAYTAIDLDKYKVQNLGFFSFSGQKLVEGEPLLGVASDLVTNRQGNKYFGEVVRIGDRIVLQGLGQYQSVTETDGVGFKTFTGRFEGDVGTGNAEILFHSGERFLGKVEREKPHGFGVWTENDGTRYYLEVIDGKRTGPAVREDNEGNRTAGEFITHKTFRSVTE